MKIFMLSVVALLFSAGLGRAACSGQDLLAALPAEERAALNARTDQHPHPRGLLFRATRDGQVLHLMGTMHLPDPRHGELMAEVTPLLAQARTLLVEADPESQARLQAEIVKRPEFIMITEGPKLNKLLPEAEWKELAARMQAHGIPPLFTARFRPWYLAMMLGMPPCATAALKQGENGLDTQIMAQAQAAGIPLRALEPYDTLFTLFDGLPLEEELEMIRGTLQSPVDPEDAMVTTVNGYFARETRLMWELTRQQALEVPGADAAAVDAQFALMEEVLMVRRNRAWIPVLTEALDAGPAFAAFGALHLPGETGVLALLEAEGFRIERLD